ncbi:acyl carrier protein [Loigolactobacillus coryniformis]|jgi:acyl carrier protein|uniref:Acyl carrier protein n=2 Tax=Loigolactobacillus coryniformis TaxID=1610 RepID=A0A0R1FAD7_9LACO|nr:acyl carrier protein [Loigolactobacillus coryniformis]MDT3392425.1 acyl carrier protein [Bacillota bacterium]OEH90446.1 acyl carrier protein [Loigolactobacillus coryniformis subsp. coryniformis]ATO43968.1 acyl carrier protein [Loigolactobacillus coryniformis subsp. torquens DSM 20004 = KCTC 3535]ATO55642.1 acyl carrier protein [Loigolactobacillus coryniformis subsp. coryniformis KCTC 3167 = DSM 20001]KRK18665.1 Acyl carrier protein (ACP) [Loigolactobacillus coryniformis subsp. coryniformis 
MSEQEIYDKIAQLIEERFELSADKVSQSLDFKKDLNADSIDIVEFILELEDTFGAEISDEDAEKLATVGDAVTYIKNHQ